MKKLILAAALFILPSTAHAQVAELCPNIASLAGTIMKVRQAGMSKETMLSKVVPNDAADITISLINMAYLTPVYLSESLKQKTIDSFKNEAEYICYKVAYE